MALFLQLCHIVSGHLWMPFGGPIPKDPDCLTDVFVRRKASDSDVDAYSISDSEDSG